MNNESWYAAKLSDMDVVRICDSDDWMVDYDRNRGMYRVSYFQDNHFKDEFWFDCYEEKEVTNKTELIGILESLKEASKDVFRENKYLSGEQFREIIDRVIGYINK